MKIPQSVRVQISNVDPNSDIEPGMHTATRSKKPSLRDGHGRKWKKVEGQVVAEGQGIVVTSYESVGGRYGYFCIGKVWFRVNLFERELPVGSRVSVIWNDGVWYTGLIQQIRPSEYLVHFDGGEKSWVKCSDTKWLDFDEDPRL